MNKAREVDVVVVGAGPYGLTATSHLAHSGLDVASFGRSLSFWRERMPEGMHLRSSWDASSIAHPQKQFRLDDYQDHIGRAIPQPIPRPDFIGYGMWYQQNAVPDLDERLVRRIARSSAGFEVSLDDGETVAAGSVVVAVGLAGMEWHPSPFDELDDDVLTHSVNLHDVSPFAGQEVVVVGSGQSAVETAVLLQEAGAKVQLLARRQNVHWLVRSGSLHRLPSWAHKLLYAPTDVGPPGLSWIVGTPSVFRRLPASLQEPIAARSIRPAASGWLKPRSSEIVITEGRVATKAASSNGRVEIVLDDETHLEADHVVLGTGYKPQVKNVQLLEPSLAQAVEVRPDGLPVLKKGLESSVPGLYFVGALAEGAYGPLMRFVSGTTFTGRTLAKTVGRR